MRLAEAILRFERHLEGAMKLKDMDVSEYLVYNSLAMECFQAVNSLIDIGEQLIARKRMGFPSSYREIFELLKEGKLLNKEELEAIKRLIFLRNVIAHEYYKVGERELIEMAELFKKVRGFVDRVKSNEGEGS